MQPQKKNKITAWIGVIVALIYLVVPTDLVPDLMPVAGWIDDAVVILVAIANAIRVARKFKN